MKAFVASLATETNTFARIPTGLDAFEVQRAPWRLGGDADHGDDAQIEAIRKLAAETGDAVEFGLIAFAQPSGVTCAEAYTALRDELLDDLRHASPVDMVVLSLHGAMVAEGVPDCEGDMIARVRDIVGASVPIGVLLDPHCHLSDAMLAKADILIAYKEYPHSDVMDRFADVWRLTRATAKGEIQPVMVAADCRIVGFWHTTRSPFRELVDRFFAAEREAPILNVSFAHGFPYGDVGDAGSKVWVIADGDADAARRTAHRFRDEIWDLRDAVRGNEIEIPDAIKAIAAHASPRPIVLADISDNAGGGAPSDSTFLLQALIEAGVANVAIGAFWDPGAIAVCCEAGEGARLALRLGGKCGPASGDPVDIDVTVKAIKEDHAQSAGTDFRSPCGRSVWVGGPNDLDLVLISRRQQVFGTDLFEGLGVPLRKKRVIVVKSSQHFHTAFAPIAGDILYINAPGLLSVSFETFQYRHRDLNYWPRVENPWEATSRA